MKGKQLFLLIDQSQEMKEILFLLPRLKWVICMTQQFLFGDADLRYKKKLFVEQGSTYVEVGAKIIEPYVPPEPSVKSKEQAIISGVSQLSGKGYASYRSKLRLLFKDKKEYSKYVMLANGTHKFYDEKGAIYTGMLESIQVTPYEGSTKYVVDVTLILVKKDKYQKRDRAKFIDIFDDDGEPLSYAEDVIEMSNLGIVSTVNIDGSPVLYFRGGDYATRAEFIALINRTRRWIERTLKE